MVSTKTKKRVLSVLMNGALIGKLEKTHQGNLRFAYEKVWLDTAGARPLSLSLPLIEQAFSGDLVYNFFDNLLPDNQQIRARIQAKFQIPTSQAFDLLASIGKDCVGAIQLIEGELPNFKKQITSEPLTSKKIGSLLRAYQNNPLGMTDESTEFRISIAGAQEKSAFLYYKNTWHRPLAGTPTTHIFKLPLGYIPHAQMDLSESCENEWLCAQIAKTFGLAVADCEILHFQDTKVLSVERFDRRLSSDASWIMRLPQEDMCQALGISPNLKYQSDGGPGINEIMQLLLNSKNSIADRDAFYRSQILFALLAAIDGHAKNFSVFIEPAGQYQLTPLYDIMSAHPMLAKKQLQAQKIKMAMALKGKNSHYHWHTLQRRHFIETAKTVHYSPEKAEALLDEMLAKVDIVIQQVSAKLPPEFPLHIAKPIFKGMIFMKQKLMQKK